MNILKPKSKQEIITDFKNMHKISTEQWEKFVKYVKGAAPFHSKHFVLIWGFPVILLGLSMGISLLTCIPSMNDNGSNIIVLKDLNNSEVVIMDSLAFVTTFQVPGLQTDSTAVTSKALVVRTPPRKEKIHLPKIFKSNINFFKRVLNIFCNAFIIFLSGLFIVLPIIAMVNTYDNDNNIHYR